nr:MAG TPA: hypothetical protein [Caudoviricetes sp.]
MQQHPPFDACPTQLNAGCCLFCFLAVLRGGFCFTHPRSIPRGAFYTLPLPQSTPAHAKAPGVCPAGCKPSCHCAGFLSVRR